MKNKKCEACDGTGWQKGAGIGGLDLLCPVCKSLGYVPGYCPTCKGRLRVVDKAEGVGVIFSVSDCPDCARFNDA